MVDYSQHKVPDLKKILNERNLGVSGNKADLIARLQEDDKKSAPGKLHMRETATQLSRRRLLIQNITAGVEDEIDWDEDDTKAPEPEPEAAAPVVAPTPQVEAPQPTPTPAAITESKPVATTDSTDSTKATDETTTVQAVTTTKASAEPEAPKPVYTLGVEATDAEKEAEKRAARAKKFGIVAPVEDDAAKKLAERAKKFGLEAKAAVVSGLDAALPDRKRGREDNRQGGRNAKRPTPDRRTEPSKGPRSTAPPPAKKAASGRILDDPVEKAKAEARAKKFGSAPKA